MLGSEGDSMEDVLLYAPVTVEFLGWSQFIAGRLEFNYASAPRPDEEIIRAAGDHAHSDQDQRDEFMAFALIRQVSPYAAIRAVLTGDAELVSEFDAYPLFFVEPCAPRHLITAQQRRADDVHDRFVLRSKELYEVIAFHSPSPLVSSLNKRSLSFRFSS